MFYKAVEAGLLGLEISEQRLHEVKSAIQFFSESAPEEGLVELSTL